MKESDKPTYGGNKQTLKAIRDALIIYVLSVLGKNLFSVDILSRPRW